MLMVATYFINSHDDWLSKQSLDLQSYLVAASVSKAALNWGYEWPQARASLVCWENPVGIPEAPYIWWRNKVYWVGWNVNISIIMAIWYLLHFTLWEIHKFLRIFILVYFIWCVWINGEKCFSWVANDVHFSYWCVNRLKQNMSL